MADPSMNDYMAMKKPKMEKPHGTSPSTFQRRLRERIHKDKETLEALD